jgi:hypothetical protein
MITPAITERNGKKLEIKKKINEYLPSRGWGDSSTALSHRALVRAVARERRIGFAYKRCVAASLGHYVSQDRATPGNQTGSSCIIQVWLEDIHPSK